MLRKLQDLLLFLILCLVGFYLWVRTKLGIPVKFDKKAFKDPKKR